VRSRMGVPVCRASKCCSGVELVQIRQDWIVGRERSGTSEDSFTGEQAPGGLFKRARHRREPGEPRFHAHSGSGSGRTILIVVF
jgi:hypothetical protein